jgi:hypothetical protein
VKRPYRDSNMREWEAHLAIHYNSTVSVDKLQQDEDGRTPEEEGGGTERGDALSLAEGNGENCVGASCVRVSLLSLDNDHNDNSTMGGGCLPEPQRKGAGPGGRCWTS